MSFFELLVVFIVGLIVIGPDKLPETIRTLMLWFGRLKRTVSETRNEFEQQLGLDEIRRELHNEQVLKALARMQSSKNSIQQEKEKFDAELLAEMKKIEDSADDPMPEHDAANYDDEHDPATDSDSKSS